MSKDESVHGCFSHVISARGPKEFKPFSSSVNHFSSGRLWLFPALTVAAMQELLLTDPMGRWERGRRVVETGGEQVEGTCRRTAEENH